MKKLIGSFLFLSFIFTAKAQYDIQVAVPEMAGQKISLAFYYEGKLRVADTLILDLSGTGHFQKNSQKLPRGLYMLYFTPSSNLELIMGDDQTFRVSCDTAAPLKTVQIEGSRENQAFLEFQHFLQEMNRQGKELSEKYARLTEKEKEDQKQKYTTLFRDLDQNARTYINRVVEEFPGSALATFVKFVLPVETPDFSGQVAADTKDRDKEIQRLSWYYAKTHYWDNTVLTDSTLLRTPNFKNHVDNYFKNMIFVHPDSLYDACVGLIEKSRSCRPMFIYLTEYCLQYTFDNKIMGMDEAFVKFGLRYYVSGEADWVDEKRMKTIRDEVYKRQYNLLHHRAVDLKMQTLEGNWVSLYETDAPFILLLFWEPNCGHCKKQVPQAKKNIFDRFSPYGLKVFSVNTHSDKKAWEDFVEKNELFDFINCWDPKEQTYYRSYYNVFSTPTMYILDKDKKFIAKSLSIEQMVDLLKQEYKKTGIEIP